MFWSTFHVINSTFRVLENMYNLHVILPLLLSFSEPNNTHLLPEALLHRSSVWDLLYSFESMLSIMHTYILYLCTCTSLLDVISLMPHYLIFMVLAIWSRCTVRLYAVSVYTTFLNKYNVYINKTPVQQMIRLWYQLPWPPAILQS